MINVLFAESAGRYVRLDVFSVGIIPADIDFRRIAVAAENKKRRRDMLLIGGILLISGIALLLTLLFRAPGDQVVVEVDGAVFGTYDLHKDAEIQIETENGGYNVLVITDGFAAVTQASCPDKLCVHQHRISHSDESIICLPNKVVISIVTHNET